MVPLALVVRWLHVLAMAVALGGGALAWAVSHTADAETTLAVATTYELAFWGAFGVLVMTGVGNLGALAPAIPRGAWGAVFLAKLGFVGALTLGSAVRSAAVHAARDAATTLALTLVVALAAVMAHG